MRILRACGFVTGPSAWLRVENERVGEGQRAESLPMRIGHPSWCSFKMTVNPVSLAPQNSKQRAVEMAERWET